MVKYFLKVLFTLLFLSLLNRVVFGGVTLLTPTNGEFFEETGIFFSWENNDPEVEYIYRYFFYVNENPYGSAITRILEERELTRSAVNHKIYFWKIQYHPLESFEGTFDYETEPFVFSVNKEIPEEIWNTYVAKEKDPENENEEEVVKEEEEEETSEREVVDIKEEEEEEENKEREANNEERTEEQVQEVQVQEELPFLESIPNNEEKKENILRRYNPLVKSVDKGLVQESEFNWNVIATKAILGVSQENSSKQESKENIVCKFKYFKKRNSLEKIYCNIPKIKFKEESRYPFANEYSVILHGEVVTSFNIQVDEYICAFNLFKPSTWFRCKEKFLQSNVLNLKPNMFFSVYKKNKKVSIRSYSLDGNLFRILAGHVKDTEGMRLVHTYKMANSQYNLYLEEKSEYTIRPRDYDDSEKYEGIKPFLFPFNKIIGVTQWYGNTAYQTPHTGIDFGAKKEGVLAVADGEVVGKGWDNYYGECLSGGNYLKVKQSNGMYTVYFHLEDMFVNTGDTVKKGQIIAKSGNSGAWNCQRLAYHLHLETRVNSSSRSHSNPVRYINVDWNSVPTLGYLTNPGRLTGENPHPGR